MAELVKVTLAVVKTARTLRPDDDLSKLTESLKEDGQHKPIVLMIDPYHPQNGLQLFDGLRRIEAMKKLGLSEASATIATQVDDLLDLIGPVDESTDFTYPLMKRWADFITQWNLLRSLGQWRLNMSRKGLLDSGEWRNPFLQKYGVTATGMRDIKMLLHLHETMEPGTDPLIEKSVSAFMAGELPPNAARYRIGKYGMVGDVTKARDQADILNGAVDTLRSISAALNSLGPPAKGLSSKDAQEWQKAFTQFSVTLRKINKNLNRENKKS